MSDTRIADALKQRMAEAHDASSVFDFVLEGEVLATWYRQATPGTTYWRCYLPARALPGQVVPIEPDSLYEEDDEVKLKHARGALIWQFLGDDGRSRIALEFQRRGVPTFMEVDDNYLRYAPPLYGKHGAWTKTHAEAVANGTGYSVEMHRKLVPMMDGIIVTTDNLAEEYAEWNANVHVCPNSVDPDDWDVQRTESETLRIGYYGSPSHNRDWPVVKKALKWAQRQPGVEVVLIGFNPPGWSGRTLPWADNLFDARANLGQIDVGIAPLTRNPWADGKSDVKALEYAMAGVMPIVQAAPPYQPWMDSGWEWNCRTPEDWMSALQDVVEMRDDVPMLAAEAKDYVLQHRTIEKNIGAWKEALSGT